ncbi:MAG: RidA family protein, partial [Bacteroidota bacterium]
MMKSMKWMVLLLVMSGLVAACSSETEQSDTDVYDPEARLTEMGIELDPPTPPTANYRRVVRSGNLLFLAGHGPDIPGGDGDQVHGTMGTDELTLEEGQQAARYTGISLLNTLKAELGDLNRVERVVKAKGMVKAAPDFTEHSQVINGFSDLMVEVFGDRGKHAREAVGMTS